jgi:hypothetical protein
MTVSLIISGVADARSTVRLQLLWWRRKAHGPLNVGGGCHARLRLLHSYYRTTQQPSSLTERAGESLHSHEVGINHVVAHVDLFPKNQSLKCGKSVFTSS